MAAAVWVPPDKHPADVVTQTLGQHQLARGDVDLLLIGLGIEPG